MDPIFRLGTEGAYVAVNPGGWSVLRRADEQLVVGFRFKDLGRIKITELYLTDPTAAGLRKIPLGAIEAAANGVQVSKMIRQQLSKPAESDAVREAVMSVIPKVSRRRSPAKPPSEDEVLVAVSSESAFRARYDGGAEILMLRPVPGKGAPDQFYLDIACLYSMYFSSEHPVVEVSELIGVPRSTIERWLTTARRKGFLRPGRR